MKTTPDIDCGVPVWWWEAGAQCGATLAVPVAAASCLRLVPPRADTELRARPRCDGRRGLHTGGYNLQRFRCQEVADPRA